MELATFCTECGSVQDKPGPVLGCCPDASPVMMPRKLAMLARAGFLAHLYLVPAAVEVSQRCDLDTDADHYRRNLNDAISKVNGAV